MGPSSFMRTTEIYNFDLVFNALLVWFPFCLLLSSFLLILLFLSTFLVVSVSLAAWLFLCDQFSLSIT